MGGSLDPNLLISLIGSSTSTLISVGAAIVAIYKAKPEIKKIKAEGDSSIGDAAESIATGAKTITDQLVGRVKDLEEREKRREKAFKEMQDQLTRVSTSLAEWQDWAKRLAHQVKSLGHEPVAFKLNKKDA